MCEMRKYERLSNSVIKRMDKELYFTKVDSAESIKKMLYGEEQQYGIDVENIEIDISKTSDANYTTGILFGFCLEPDGEGKCSCFDVIISDVIGTYISDWY